MVIAYYIHVYICNYNKIAKDMFQNIINRNDFNEGIFDNGRY
jgi:hypothetical protein